MAKSQTQTEKRKILSLKYVLLGFHHPVFIENNLDQFNSVFVQNFNNTGQVQPTQVQKLNFTSSFLLARVSNKSNNAHREQQMPFNAQGWLYGDAGGAAEPGTKLRWVLRWTKPTDLLAIRTCEAASPKQLV